MRILVVHPGPNFSVADVYMGWVEALRKLGQDVAVFNLDDRLTFFDRALIEVDRRGDLVKVRKAVDYKEAINLTANTVLAACYQVWPDVVLGISAFFLPPVILEIMQKRRHKIVLVHTESPYQDEEQLERAKYTDVSIINDPTNLDKYREVTRTEYLPQAYRPHLHKPGPSIPRLESDLAFVGTAFESRVNFLEAMNLKGLDVLLGGNWTKLDKASHLFPYIAHDVDECLDNLQTVDVYRSAMMGINIYRRESNYWGGVSEPGWAMGPREVEMAACGLPFLRDPRPEGDEVLSMEPTFSSPEDASEKLKWWLARPRTRERVAAQARWAIEDRTFENNAKRLLRMLDA